MSGELTEVTELSTALGMLSPDLHSGLAARPPQLANVTDEVWERLAALHESGRHTTSFDTSFANGRAFLLATDGLRGRRPLLVEWKGPHRPPGDEVIPADLRVDHVYLVSCKYLSKVMMNAGPRRLFDRLLTGDERSTTNWFAEVAPTEFQALYEAARDHTGSGHLPDKVTELTRDQQKQLKAALSARTWPEALRSDWGRLCDAVALESARRWRDALESPRDRLKVLWRMLRISSATYFVLGTDRTDHLRFRVGSNWDWMQAYELRTFEVAPRPAGQPEVTWRARVRRRECGSEVDVDGHVEIRWSHGRFVGFPEAKVYLDTPHSLVPGYEPFS